MSYIMILFEEIWKSPQYSLVRIYLKTELKHLEELQDANNTGSEWAPGVHTSPRTKQCECKSIYEPEDVFDFNPLSPDTLN